jgi:hypothetical protein
MFHEWVVIDLSSQSYLPYLNELRLNSAQHRGVLAVHEVGPKVLRSVITSCGRIGLAT